MVHADHSFGDHCSDFLFLGPQERQEVMAGLTAFLEISSLHQCKQLKIKRKLLSDE